MFPGKGGGREKRGELSQQAGSCGCHRKQQCPHPVGSSPLQSIPGAEDKSPAHLPCCLPASWPPGLLASSPEFLASLLLPLRSGGLCGLMSPTWDLPQVMPLQQSRRGFPPVPPRHLTRGTPSSLCLLQFPVYKMHSPRMVSFSSSPSSKQGVPGLCCSFSHCLGILPGSSPTQHISHSLSPASHLCGWLQALSVPDNLVFLNPSLV